MGPALSDTINQAAPTLCMNVPTSETTSAMSRLRKVDDLRGRQRLAELFLAEIATAIRLVSSNYRHLFGPGSHNDQREISEASSTECDTSASLSPETTCLDSIHFNRFRCLVTARDKSPRQV